MSTPLSSRQGAVFRQGGAFALHAPMSPARSRCGAKKRLQHAAQREAVSHTGFRRADQPGSAPEAARGSKTDSLADASGKTAKSQAEAVYQAVSDAETAQVILPPLQQAGRGIGSAVRQLASWAGDGRLAGSTRGDLLVASATGSLSKSSSNASTNDSDVELALARRSAKRTTLRLGLPSKGRMAEDTQQLLKDCQLSVYKPNPRQYVATISQLPQLEVWFQRASDVVRKLVRGDLDLGIVGADMFAEIAAGSPDLIVLHDGLDFGHCHLGLGVPTTGRFADINTLQALKEMPEWSAQTPLRVVTGYHSIAEGFFREAGFEHVTLLAADGALEAHPAMGSADIILDLVSTGVTLRENNLKEIQGGKIMESQGVLVGNRAALLERPKLLAIVHELIERFEAHLTAGSFYSAVTNMRGTSAEDVAAKVLACEALQGLQGPTVSPVYTHSGSDNGSGQPQIAMWSAMVCVPKYRLYQSVKEMRKLGGSGVLVQPMTYIFDEEPSRWRQLVDSLGLDESQNPANL